MGLRRILARVGAWWAHLFARPTPPPAASRPAPAQAEPSLEAPVVEREPAQPAPIKRRRRSGKSADVIGLSFIHFEDILTQIPTCRKIMRALRRVDQDAYDYFGTVGAKILRPSGSVERDERWREFLELLPSRGMVYHPPPTGDGDHLDGTVIYYYKLDKTQPHLYVAQNDAICAYRLIVAWYDARKKRMAYAYEYVVSLNEAGDMHVVIERSSEYVKLPNGGGFSRMVWRVPRALEVHYRDRKECNSKLDIEAHNAEEFGCNNFRLSAAIHADTGHEFQVRATRHGVTVAFSVALGRTPYFFKDRQTEATTDGKRRRIFHQVAEHERTYQSGKVATIPQHYRGERHFMWHGEAVSVAPPEQSDIHFDAKAWEGDDIPADIKTVGTKDVAKLMVEVFEHDKRKRA